MKKIRKPNSLSKQTNLIADGLSDDFLTDPDTQSEEFKEAVGNARLGEKFKYNGITYTVTKELKDELFYRKRKYDKKGNQTF